MTPAPSHNKDNTKLITAISNFEKLIVYLIDSPPPNININDLVRDYNTIKQELNKILVNK